jgi:hypothetical protein
MASQELYSTVSAQLEERQVRLQESVQALDWEAAAVHASCIADLAGVLVAIMKELETE